MTENTFEGAPWLAALAHGRAPPPPEVASSSLHYATLERAWHDGDSVALVVWLAARLAPTLAELVDVVDTARLLVQERLPFRGPDHLDVVKVFARLSSAWPGPGDGGALGEAKGLDGAAESALVCFLAAESTHALADAMTRVAGAAQAPGGGALGLRAVPASLSLAVNLASGAYAHYYMARGAPFAAVPRGCEFVLSRHALVPSAGVEGYVVRSKKGPPPALTAKG